MASINYKGLKDQLLAQRITLPELNFCLLKESNQISQDCISENFGTGTASPVIMSEGQVRNDRSCEFGQSLERDYMGRVL